MSSVSHPDYADAMDGKNDEFDPYPLEQVRSMFPMLSKLKDTGYVYLDSAATSLTPQPVIDAVSRYYSEQRVTIHRGGYPQARELAEAYESVRSRTAAFIGASRASEIVFTKSATESLNLVAWGWAAPRLKAGDEILVSGMEHHANFVPWQQIAKRTGAGLRVIPIDPQTGNIDMSAFRSMLSAKVRVAAVTGMSNVTGAEPPLAEIAELIHDCGGVVVVDGTQLVAHRVTRLRELGCDFLAFSGHKLCAPTGVGVLCGKQELLQTMTPLLYGGDMILTVSEKRSTFQDPPRRFEGGTPNISGVLGLGAAIDFLGDLGMERIAQHEHSLAHQLIKICAKSPYVELVRAPEVPVLAGIVSFTPVETRQNEILELIESAGVMVRAGKLCAHPFLNLIGSTNVIRASCGPYTSSSDIDALADVLSQ